jgi:uncharacterized OsmC-like protein
MGDHHFVVDHAVGQEGPGEQPGPVEYFLSGVSSCGVLMVEREAKNRGIPLQWLEVTINAVRRDPAGHAGGPMTFQSASVDFDFVGPTEAQATSWANITSAPDRSMDRSPWRPRTPQYASLPGRHEQES